MTARPARRVAGQGFYWPYLRRAEMVEADPRDYADPKRGWSNATTHQWLHPVGDVVTAVIDVGAAVGLAA